MSARVLIAVASIAAGALLPAASASATPSTGLVISQVYGGGGNSGATVRNDYIELFNRGTTPVTLNGTSLQYASATGSFTTSSALPNATLAPGQYYLVGEATGASTTVPLVAADFTDPSPIAMSATAGKVALVSNTTALNCGPTAASCAAAASNIIDLIGYGPTASYFEGSGPAPAPSNMTADLRAAAGCTDTDRNTTDFSTGAVNPRNLTTVANPCGGADAAPTVSTSTPSGPAPAPADTNLTVTFSEPVNVTPTAFALSCTSSGAHAVTVSGGPTTFTLDPTTDFSPGESCTLTVRADQVSDQDTNDPPDRMAADYTATFTIATTSTRIRDIQGAAHRSPLVGTVVGGVRGIVTAVRSNGFYFEDPNPDADPATSEGLFAFTSSAPAGVRVGDSVSVGGKVAEFRPGGSRGTGNLTSTELTGPTFTVLSTGNPLPLTIVGPGGRVPPTTVVEDDASDVETNGVFDPANDGIDFYESLEGMRLRVDEPKVVGATTSNGELAVVPGGGAFGGLFTPRGGILLRADDANPERVLLDDAIVPIPAANVGDTLSAPPVGVLDYSFGNFKLEVTNALTVTATGPAREVGTAPATDELAIANFNVENLDPGDTARIPQLAGQVVGALRSPDVLALQEIQDNNGATNDAVTDASASASALIDAIVAAGGPRYRYVDINPVDDQDGGEPGGNIRVAYLYREDRGLRFVARPGGTATASTTVLAGPDGPTLSASPGRIDPTNTAFNSSRKPLAAEFTYHGKRLFIINNHFISKGGDDPVFGHRQPPVRSSETQRNQQASIVNAFVKQILAQDAAARIVVAGDLNDFDFSQTLANLKGNELVDLIATLPANERYDYVFDGNSQVLDHILTSSALAPSTRFDPVHINAEYADQVSDHDPELALVSIASPPAPACTVTAIRRPASGNAEQDVTVTAGAGLASVQNVQISNGQVFLGGASGTRIDDQASTPLPGSPTSLVLTAVKTTPGVTTRWSFDVTDTAGQTTHCT